jgi:serine/threonine protein kinase
MGPCPAICENAGNTTEVGKAVERDSSMLLPPAHDSAQITLGADAPAEPVLSTLAERGTLGRYHILGVLGMGGMGAVYRAFDPELARIVALKVMRLSTARAHSENIKSALRTRMLREARGLAKLSHPNIVAIYDIGTTEGGDPFLAMEYLPGEDLKEHFDSLPIRRRKWRTTLGLFLDAGAGLAAAHHAGFVHRDFKPANCMLANDGVVRVLDFGLVSDLTEARKNDVASSTLPAAAQEADGIRNASVARGDNDRALVEGGTDGLTRAGTILGTPRYMAPEQAMGLPATARTDVFSFCLSCYECLTGDHPFDQTTSELRLKSIANPHFRWPVAIPHDLRRLIERGMDFDPMSRPASLAEWLDEAAAIEARRSRKSRVFGLGGATLATAAFAAAFAIRSGKPTKLTIECAKPISAIHDLWNPASQEMLRDRFRRADSSLGEQSWNSTQAILQRFVEAWSRARRVQCFASHPEQATSSNADERSDFVALTPADAELAKLCLDQRWASFDAVLAGWRDVHAEDVRGAVRVASYLHDPRMCLDPHEVRAATPLPEDPRARIAVQEMRTQLARAGVLLEQLRPQEASALLDAIDVALQSQPDPATRADYLATRARHDRLLHGDGILTLDLVERSMFAAVAAGHWRTAAQNRMRSLFTRMYLLGNRDIDVDSELRQVESWIDASGGAAPNLLAQLARTRGIYVAAVQGHPNLALPHFQASLRHSQSTGANPFLLASALEDLAFTERQVHRNDQALAHAHRSALALESLYGKEHPELVKIRAMIGELVLERGDFNEGLNEIASGVRGCLRMGAGFQACPGGVLQLALASEQTGHLAQATQLLTALVELGIPPEAMDRPGDTPPTAVLARILAARGEWTSALQLAEQGGDQTRSKQSRVAAQMVKATLWMKAGHADVAERIWERTKTEMPDYLGPAHALVRSLRIQMLDQQHNLDALIREFDSRSADPDELILWATGELPALQIIRAHMLLALGDSDQASSFVEHSLAARRRSAPNLHFEDVEGFGKIRLRLGQPYLLLEEIDAARKAFDPNEVLESRLAGLDFLEAQARWMSDESAQGRARARWYAAKALASYRTWGTGSDRNIRDIEAWLAGHPLRPARHKRRN